LRSGAGKIALPGADLAVLSAHKFGGPVGIGALLLRDWGQIQPSGGQERGYRPGTENLPGALAMAAALEAGADWMAEASRLRARLEIAMTAAGGEVVAAEAAAHRHHRRLSHEGQPPPRSLSVSTGWAWRFRRARPVPRAR
jgi:cysteine sulfinate desulfinase/cysteine desulfurase-like protein